MLYKQLVSFSHLLLDLKYFSIAFFVSSVFNGDLIVNPMDIPKYTFYCLTFRCMAFPHSLHFYPINGVINIFGVAFLPLESLL